MMVNNYPETILIFDSPRAEYSCVWNALYIHLGRRPTEHDLRLTSQLPDKKKDDRFYLFYNHRIIGQIRMIYRLKQLEPFRVSFTPISILN